MEFSQKIKMQGLQNNENCSFISPKIATISQSQRENCKLAQDCNFGEVKASGNFSIYRPGQPIWKSAIFLPFWFYVKSILVDFRRSKTATLTVLNALKFNFGRNFPLKNAKMYQKCKIQSFSKAVFGFLKSTLVTV